MATIVIPQPYPGIRPFKENDWPIFFGREAQSNQLLHKLETTRFVAVVGSSGSGKSSLVRAGLIPLIRQGFLRNVTDWGILLCRPGVDPFSALAYEVSQLDRPRSVEEGSENRVGSVTSSLIAADLRASADGVVSVLEKLELPKTRHILLIVDQFEEIFGFRSSWTAENAASRGEAERFVDCVLQSCAADVTSPLVSEGASLPQRIWVLLTMRSDFIGHCEVFPALARCVSDSQFLVPVLNSEQKKEAITRPGETDNIEGSSYKAFDFDEGIVSVIVNETGDRLDQLPLMQHALMRTWKLANLRSNGDTKRVRIALDDYKAAGRIEEALHNDAENAWKEIADNPKLARITQQMFLLLCDTSEDGKLTRKRPKVSFVMAATGAQLEDLEAILGSFQRDDRNFLRPLIVPLTTRRLAPEDALDVSHEALLRQWRTYRSWQVENRRSIEELIDLRRRAQLNAQKREPLLAHMTLERLRKWQVTKAWALRYVAETEWNSIQDFIERSKRKRRLLVSLVGLAVLTILSLAVWALSLLSRQDLLIETARLANARTGLENQKAQKEHALRLLSTIGTSEDDPSSQERAAIWELAELKKDEEPVRGNALEEWFRSAESTSRALARHNQGLVAAIGIDPERLETLRQDTVELLIDSAQDKKKGLPDAEALSAFSSWLTPGGAKRAADALASAMKSDETDAARLPILGNALAQLLKCLKTDDAKVLASRGAGVLALAIDKTQEGDINRLSSLSAAFASLIRAMDGEEAKPLAQARMEILTKALEKGPAPDEARLSSSPGPRTQNRSLKSAEGYIDSDPLSTLGNALVILTGIVKSDDANELAARGAIGLIHATDRLDRFEMAGDRAFRWGGIIAELGRTTNRKETSEINFRAASVLAFTLGMRSWSYRDSSLNPWPGLAELVRGMKAEDRERFGEMLLGALENMSDATGKLNLSIGIIQIAAVMDADQAKRLTQRAATLIADALVAMEKPKKKETAKERLTRVRNSSAKAADLGNALARLLKVMKPIDAAPLARRGFLALLERQMYAEWLPASPLIRLSKTAATSELIKQTKDAMGQVTNDDANSLWCLASALNEMTKTLKTDEAIAVRNDALTVLIGALVRTAESEPDKFQPIMIVSGITKLSKSMGPDASVSITDRASEIVIKVMGDSRLSLVNSWNLAWGLGQLCEAMPSEKAATMAERGGTVVVAIMERQNKDSVDPKQIGNLGIVLADLCGFIKRSETGARLANQGATVVSTTQGKSASETSKLGQALLTLSARLHGADETRRFGLDEAMSAPIPEKAAEGEPDSEERGLFVTAISAYEKQELAEILKSPFCVGEAQKIALAEIEEKIAKEDRARPKFNGNVWRFVDLATELRISNLDGAAERPTREKAIKELQQVSAGGR